jgi:hypothetical protein
MTGAQHEKLKGALVWSSLFLLPRFQKKKKIYHLTSLDVPSRSMLTIKKIERAFLWAGTDKISGGQGQLGGCV